GDAVRFGAELESLTVSVERTSAAAGRVLVRTLPSDGQDLHQRLAYRALDEVPAGSGPTARVAVAPTWKALSSGFVRDAVPPGGTAKVTMGVQREGRAADAYALSRPATARACVTSSKWRHAPRRSPARRRASGCGSARSSWTRCRSRPAPRRRWPPTLVPLPAGH